MYKKDSTLDVDALMKWVDLPYIMLAVLTELKTAYEEKIKINHTWENSSVHQVAELLGQLEDIARLTKEKKVRICSEIMKKSTYLVDYDLWIKTMEVLIYEYQTYVSNDSVPTFSYKWMNKKTIIKIIVDVLMTAALLFLMPYEMIGEALHEWIGVGMFLLFAIHHVLNRKWTGNILKGKYTPYRAAQTILVALVLTAMLGSMISGIILSRHVFSYLEIRGGSVLAGTVHMICAYWGFTLMSLHLGMHWSMMMGMAGKCFKHPSVIRKWIARTVATVIAGYGCYAFMKRNIGSYMLMQAHFVFFDFEEPVVLFILDYMAAMGMVVYIGHYIAILLRKAGKRKVKNT